MWVLPATGFERLAATMQASVCIAGKGLVLTDAAVPSQTVLRQRSIDRFLVAVSPQFSGLVLGERVQVAELEGDAAQANSERQERYQTTLHFEPATIVAFLTDLQPELSVEPLLQTQIAQAIQQIQPNDATLQAEFTLRLAAVLTNQRAATDANVGSLVGEPIDRVEQDTVLSQVAAQIRQTQELSLILKTAIQQVRSFLQADRVVIYEFESSLERSFSEAQSEPANASGSVCGRITYEDRATAAIPRILNLSEGMQCFIGVPDYQEKYRKGVIQAVDDIRATYVAAPCLIHLLNWARVRAKLVVPIVVQDQLWGLLIAHQCFAVRHWLESEIRFLRCVSELLAIAIYQTHLNSQLQQQAQTLEQRVIERTQELHDTLNAAQSASLTKTEFLASVSHELRTPLTAIIGMATTLLRLPTDANRQRSLPPEKQQDYLRIIRKSGEHLLELINDMLDLSQVESGRTVLEIQEFSLSQVANECLRMLRDKAHQNQLTLILDLQLESQSDGSSSDGSSSVKSDRFTADPRRVRQILLNLLSNAIKFTPAGGQVVLRVWLEHGHALFQVEDTGIGISAEQFPLLFQKFQQLDTSYHRQYEGTGLGLALSKQLVELHRGKIEVTSTVNLGSTFTVWLPPQPLPGKVDRVSPAVALTDPAHGRVVLIENHETTANLICDLLTAAGHQVVWMVDGMTAIQQIELLKPEAVVVNAHLNGMSTSEVLQRLRQNPSTQTVRILVLTEEGEAERDRCLPEGADAWVGLPLMQPEELLNQVRGKGDRR